MTATFVDEAIGLAHVVVVDMQCCYVKREIGKVATGSLDMQALEQTFEAIGNHARAATILAFMEERTAFAERNDVDIKNVTDAVRVRPNHSNLMLPGPGVGGYCLPKDGALGA